MNLQRTTKQLAHIRAMADRSLKKGGMLKTTHSRVQRAKSAAFKRSITKR